MGNYLGRGLDRISNIEILDNLVFDNSSSYSITKNSVAFTPNSAQSLLISIDGVVQATNFTVNSSTIDFGVAIPSTSVCNFFLHYGTGVMTVPSDGSVTTAKLGDGSVTSAKLSAGKVLQYVRGTSSTEFVQASPSNNTLYFPSSNKLTASITPTSTSNKILVQYISTIQPTISGTGDLGMAMVLKESISGGSTTNIYASNSSYNSGIYHQLVTNNFNIRIRLSEILERTPSTTSAITYEVGIFGWDANEIKLNIGDSRGEIILMEISA